MSTGVSTATPPSRSRVPRASLLARAVGAFSGPVGLAVKLVLLGGVNALALWAIGVLLAEERWLAAALVAGATLLVDAVYLLPDRRLVPLKFIVPGTIFLVAFVVVPIVSNANIAFTNWSTGHNLAKDEAIARIQETSLTPPADGTTYAATPAKQDGELVLLLVDETTGEPYVGSAQGLEPLPPDAVTIDVGTITAAEGYEVVTGQDLATIDTELASLTIPTGEGSFVRAEGLSLAVELEPTLRYDAAADTFTNIETGVVYADNGEGSYASAAGEELLPGWKTHVGFENFSTILTDPLVRDP
ncbi:MAG TPA: hypothetical protein VIA10_06190, partial [Gaiellaceae bacterium]